MAVRSSCRDTSKVEASLPEGFQDQLNGVVRAVLLGQPARSILAFIADFLEAQVDDRTQRELDNEKPTSDNPPSQSDSAAAAAAAGRETEQDMDADTAVRSADRGTQTPLEVDAPAPRSCECDGSSPVNASGTTLLVKCTQTVDVPVPHRPPCPPLFHRSVYSGWTAPPDVERPEEPARDGAVSEGRTDVEGRPPEPCGNQPSFADSAADDHQLTSAVRRCRQHVDDVGREAASVECLLNELACASPQRDRVLAAIRKLDGLRQRINATQRLLVDVDAMIVNCDRTQPPQQPQSRSPATSRTELLQRELGRLNSRLCCTVLALERATSRAICRGTQSAAGGGGVAAATQSTAGALDHCCASGPEKPTDTGGDEIASDQQPAVASQSAPDTGATTTTAAGVCEQWLNSLPPQPADPPVPDDSPPQQPEPDARQPCYPFEPCRSPSPCPTAPPPDDEDPTSSSPLPQQNQQQQEEETPAADNSGRDVSLEDIHRKLGNIISDIDHPADDRDDDPTTESRQLAAVDVTSNPSLMTDSAVASSTDLLGAAPDSREQTADPQSDA